MKLINLIPLKEIDFSSQGAFDTYNKQHKLRPDTKVNIAGKNTTAGKAAQSSTPVKGTSVFGGDKTPSTKKVGNDDVDVSDYKTDGEGKVLYKGKKVADYRYNINTDELTLNTKDGIKVFDTHKDMYKYLQKKKEEEPKKQGFLSKMANMFTNKDGGGDKKPDASLNGISTLNKAKPEDLVPSVENHLNKVSGGNGYAQIDDGSGAIVYNMGDGDMPTYTLYMGKEGNKHRVSLEPTYGNDPKKLQGKIDKSFDNPKDAIKFMGDVAKKHRRELEMDDNKKSDTSLSSMIPNKATQKYDPATAFNQKVSKMTDNNDHSAAAVELAIYMDDKEAVQKLQQIKKLRDNRGYLRPSEAKERGEMVNTLLQRAQKELPKKDFDLVSSAF
jgi:hypothetical protein